MKYSINLIPKKKQQESLVDKVVYFFLNYLRYIFVITQLIIIGVFFYRFRIDQSIVDLKESIDQKEEIIQVVYPLIQEAEKIDTRTKEIRNILAGQTKTEQILDYILSIFPSNIYLNNMILDKDSLKMYGLAQKISQLQVFYLRLQKEKRFEMIDLKDLKKTDDGYTFYLNLNKFKTI